jgi:hypothetical protein
MTVATHAADWLVVTTLGNELSLAEKVVYTLEDVVVPNKVKVGLGLHAIVEMGRGRVICRLCYVGTTEDDIPIDEEANLNECGQKAVSK